MSSSSTKLSKHSITASVTATSGTSSNKSTINEPIDPEVYSVTPEFIYGGPFIKVEKPTPFLNTATPINLQLQGTFKKSFAYYSLKERLPIILTKVIDYLSREGAKIKSSCGASDEDVLNFMQYVTKLKNDLVTNKKYELLSADTPDAKRWNEWILSADSQYYFTNVWVFSECYVYRRLRDGCEISKGLKTFDPFDEQKQQAFTNGLEPMCVVADKLLDMLPPSDKDKRKADFITLLKICLWANKCDLSLSLGEQVSLKAADSNSSRVFMDPFQMIIDFKDKLLVDDTGKICDGVVARAETMAKTIEGSVEESKPDVVKTEETQEEGEDEKRIPCPAKMTVPLCVMFDIVCDNSAYELFTDLCLAHFLVSQNIVKMVRFHVKSIPWFVSDVTPRDFNFVINACSQANFSREVSAPSKEGEGEGETQEGGGPISINSDSLRKVASSWARYVEEGTFVVMCDDFWTSPHCYKDMKKYDPNLYRKLQFATAVLFKGDLNYRKLLGERNCSPVLGFEPALQGFMPAPVVALRTVKADLICGLPKGKAEQLNKIDEKWMEKGDYGVIQYCAKAEPLKLSERPCEDYGTTCRGVVCPEQKIPLTENGP